MKTITKEKVLIFLFGIGIAFIAFLILIALVKPALATGRHHHFNQEIHKCKWNHTCEASPSATLTPTLGVTETPTPTPLICKGTDYPYCIVNWDRGGIDCICQAQDTPTPTPELTPEATPRPIQATAEEKKEAGSSAEVKQEIVVQPTLMPEVGWK